MEFDNEIFIEGSVDLLSKLKSWHLAILARILHLSNWRKVSVICTTVMFICYSNGVSTEACVKPAPIGVLSDISLNSYLICLMSHLVNQFHVLYFFRIT